MFKTYKYRLYPSPEQEVLLAKHFGCVRWVYNWGLNLKNKASLKKERVKHLELSEMLPILKTKEETAWLGEVNAQCLQQALRNLEKAYENFSKKRAGFPKFKSKKSHYYSFQCPQGVKIIGGQLMLPKFDKGIRVVLNREFEGKIKTVTILRKRAGDYYISIFTDNGSVAPTPTNKKNALGIDLGQTHFASFSNGEKIENPRFLQKRLKKLVVLQKRLEKKRTGSKNREKLRLRLARSHARVTNMRKDFHHKLSYKLTHDNQVDTICVEDLNVKGLLEKWDSDSRGISDVGWGQFLTFVKYKCDWYGKNYVEIGRYDPSTKTCNACGHINDVARTDKVVKCSKCGNEQDRDIGAAINIRNFGLLSGENIPVKISGKDIPVVSSSAKARKESSDCEVGSPR